MNILSNAGHAISGEGTIYLESAFDEKFVFIKIKDSGIGMTKEVKDHIFEPFYTTKDVGKGTGLGLSISYGIIQDHNGKIEVNSEVGKGSEFVIKIPRE